MSAKPTQATSEQLLSDQSSGKRGNTGKRKRPAGKVPGIVHPRKRLQVRDARIIAVQTTGQAYKNGEIDVNKYVKAREYEIRALEQGIGRAKKELNARAFQDVPRELRRRTASHNVKRVPKRLRARALKEVCPLRLHGDANS